MLKDMLLLGLELFLHCILFPISVVQFKQGKQLRNNCYICKLTRHDWMICRNNVK